MDNRTGKTHQPGIRHAALGRLLSSLTLAWLLAAGINPAQAAEQTQAGAKEGSRIIGEQEVPPGLYIMSWRDTPTQGLRNPSLTDRNRLAQPIDPDVLARELDYDDALSGRARR